MKVQRVLNVQSAQFIPTTTFSQAFHPEHLLCIIFLFHSGITSLSFNSQYLAIEPLFAYLSHQPLVKAIITMPAKSRFVRLDAFTKTVEDARVRTTSGGIVTIVSLLVIFWLTWGEWSEYRRIVVRPELVVDKGRGKQDSPLELDKANICR